MTGTCAPFVVAGSSSPELARELAGVLEYPLADCLIEHFPDGELHVELRRPARGQAAYIVQATAAPVGEALLELLLLADACWRGGASSITAILPYLGLARQDRRSREGEALGIAVAADVLSRGRFARVVTLDLHSPATEGCFAMPLENVSAVPLLAETVRRHIDAGCVVVAPDHGAARMARAYSRALELPVALVHKWRRSPGAVQVDEVVGEVAGRRPILVDDMISTGGTIAAALDALAARGARPGAIVVATHLVPDAGATERLAGRAIDRLVVTDSLRASPAGSVPIERVTIARLLADVIERLHRAAPLDELFSAR